MARVQRFYSILNHKLVTVHCVSNLRLAVDWVNLHPSRVLCDPLRYHPVYAIMRKTGKFLFELGGLEASIVESQLWFGVEGRKAIEFGVSDVPDRTALHDRLACEERSAGVLVGSSLSGLLESFGVDPAAVGGVPDDIANQRKSVLVELERLGFRARFVDGTGYLMVGDARGNFFSGYDLAKAGEVARKRAVDNLVASGRVG